MQKNDSPCFNCPDRCAGCHGKCERYAEWHNNHVDEQRRIRTIQEELNTMRSYKVECALRNKKRRAHGDTRR
jgi:hypothetical protein